MLLRLRFFARYRELAGSAQAEKELAEGSTVADLIVQLSGIYRLLERHWPSALIAVNGEYVERTHRLADRDEVAFLPPLSGG